MKVELTIKREFEVKYLQVEAGVRYWEDSYVNGKEDTENGDNIPCKKANAWCPLIDIETGKILNWKEGTTADLHYKVCDDGRYKILDESKNLIKEIDSYVIKMLCPEENGFGDYIIMNIDENGKIANWNPSFEEFSNEDDY